MRVLGDGEASMSRPSPIQPASAAQEADWPRLAAPRCRPGHVMALLKPARRHSGQTLVEMGPCVVDIGEAVSVDGTHLGHNLPDSKGNRYCINLVSVAGLPPDDQENKAEL